MKLKTSKEEKRNKVVLVLSDLTVYIGNPKRSIEKLLELISEVSTATECSI